MVYICFYLRMAKHNLLGKQGETEACGFLENKGYTILERNWRSSHRELDIVAEHDGWLVVVEVKTRTGEPWEAPENAIDQRKIRHIVNATHHYVRHHFIDLPVRFDVITVVFTPESTHIEHLEDAFLATHAMHYRSMP